MGLLASDLVNCKSRLLDVVETALGTIAPLTPLIRRGDKLVAPFQIQSLSQPTSVAKRTKVVVIVQPAGAWTKNLCKCESAQ